ncbi:MAG: hypothetical protein AAB152_00540 [Candidatus Coatesbacteria bacterium]
MRRQRRFPGKFASRGRRGAESGSATVLTLIGLMMAALVTLTWWRSYQQVRASLHFERALVAEYAAEGGLALAVGAAETGSASSVWSGRIGDGLYQTRLSTAGGRKTVVSRGYWSPGRGGPKAALIARLFRGGGYKTRLTVTGRVVAGRFVTDSVQRIP